MLIGDRGRSKGTAKPVSSFCVCLKGVAQKAQHSQIYTDKQIYIYIRSSSAFIVPAVYFDMHPITARHSSTDRRNLGPGQAWSRSRSPSRSQSRSGPRLVATYEYSLCHHNNCTFSHTQACMGREIPPF